MADYLSNPDEAKEYSDRYKFMYLMIILITFTYFIRLWYLQLYKGNEFRFFSDRNRIKIEKLEQYKKLKNHFQRQKMFHRIMLQNSQ